jgi:hypothetical protein
MSCPPVIAAVVLELMETGLLRIRSLGWSGQADRCAIEADHIHNLPGLLIDYSRERLSDYWEVERTAYLTQTPESQRTGWEPLWQRLRPHTETVGASTSLP